MYVNVMARQRILFFTSYSHSHFSLSLHRWIFSTTHLDNSSWMDKIKGVFTGSKPTSDSDPSSQSFTLLRFADELKNARKLGTFKQYIVGRSSEATFADAFEKQEAIIRYLGGFDNTGENLQSSQKQEAAKHCNCTIADVENTLAKFTWAKEAHKKVEKLKEEGKPMPKSLAEVQKLMGSTPMDLARSNLAKSGQISRNALCPCGSKKRYKRILTGTSFCGTVLTTTPTKAVLSQKDNIMQTKSLIWKTIGIMKEVPRHLTKGHE